MWSLETKRAATARFVRQRKGKAIAAQTESKWPPLLRKKRDSLQRESLFLLATGATIPGLFPHFVIGGYGDTRTRDQSLGAIVSA